MAEDKFVSYNNNNILYIWVGMERYFHRFLTILEFPLLLYL